MEDNSNNRVMNFNPGPSKIPKEVLLHAQKELLDYNGTGISVMEMSHRSKDFMSLMSNAQNSLIELLDIPTNYKLLFLQGGGRGKFASVPMNLLHRKPSHLAHYVVTGSWSSMAAKEAEKYGKVEIVHDKLDEYHFVPDVSDWEINPEASYIYYCANETVNGVEFNFIPDVGDVPLVVDMSSNILSRPFDVSKFGMIFAGAQKNIGCAGVTLVIIREDLMGFAMKECPSVWNFQLQCNANSMLNTPPCYSIYLMGLVFDWLKKKGGLLAIEEQNILKSKAIYDVVDDSDGFYHSPVQAEFKSRMNIPIRIAGGNTELEQQFLEAASKRNMIGLKGHRSVGGIRVSLYNAVSLSDAKEVAKLMTEFQQQNKK